MKQKSKPLLAYFGHHKVASTWMSLIIERVSKELHLNHTICFDPASLGKPLEDFIRDNNVDFISLTNASPKTVRNLDYSRAVHIIRDPRDIIISGYFSHLISHPVKGHAELTEMRDKLIQVPKEEGLLLEMEYSRLRFKALINWDFNQPRIMEVKLEDIILSPMDKMTGIFSFLGLLEGKHSLLNDIASKVGLHTPTNQLTHLKLAEILEENRFERLSQGRVPGVEDINSHYRKGIAGDWKNHFTRQHKDHFNNLFPGLLVKLGYEGDDAW